MLISHDAKMQVVWQHLCCCRSKLMCGLVCPCATLVVRRVPRIILPLHCSILGYKLGQWCGLFLTE